MKLWNNTYAKIITLLVLLLIPIIILYSLSNRVSVNVLKKEIESVNSKDLSFLSNEINSSADNLSTMAFLLSEDIHIQALRNINLLDSAYARNEEKSRLMERLRLLNVTERWDTQYSVIAPQIGEIVSTNFQAKLDMDELKKVITPTWKYELVNVAGVEEKRFIRHIVKPAVTIHNPASAGLIVEISFPQKFMSKELDIYKQGGKGDPFLYNPTDGLIVNKTADLDKIQELTTKLDPKDILSTDSQVVTLKNKDYLVNVVLIPSLNWYLIDYVPLHEILQPIVRSRDLFYTSVSLLLIMSLAAAYLLYRNVQRPIGALIRGVQRLRIGDYSTRITGNPKNEFIFLFQRFNEMAAEIERLIQTVYVEQIRAREATLKQLQSQINPHFLYNCFALIRSLSRLGKKESVMELAMHLSRYYRYTTRVEKLTATIEEELSVIESYLGIQQLHLQRLSYSFDVPNEMLGLEVPRLLLQPLVENAVIHGIEPVDHYGIITIKGLRNDRFNILIIEDNGIGMTDEQLAKLHKDIMMPPNEETGCALWNIFQRLLLQFGNDASMQFSQRPEGGTACLIQWPIPTSLENKEI